MDVDNMKVADLKRELKARNLSTTGVKTELADRLRAVLEEEPKDTESQESVVPATEDDIGVLSDCDEGALLNEDELLHKPIVSETKPVEKPAVKTLKTISSLQKEGILQPMEDDLFSDVPKPSASGMTEEERKALRAKKFNLEASSEEKLQIRAKKFGGAAATAPAAEADEKKSKKIGETPEVDKDKLLERAKRFGLDVNEEGKQVVQPKPAASKTKEAVKLVSGITVDAEVLKKRAERFGQNVSKVGQKLEEEDKLLKRKQKFELASDVAKTAEEPVVKQARKPIVF